MDKISRLKCGFQEFPGKKTRIFFACGAFLSRAAVECLSKCPNSEKTPLPEKIPGYAPEPIQCTERIYNKIANQKTIMNFYFGNHQDIYIGFHLNRKKLEVISNVLIFI